MTNYFGWQPSLLSRDLSSGSEWGSMNIHMNQAWADMQARSTLYMTPTTSWSAFCDYGMPSGGMNFLLDPQFTIGQWQWNNNNCGFNWGNINSGFNMNNPWGNFGWNGGNTSGTGSSASTPEERAAQKKYNKLLALVKQLASDDSKLPAARKEALDEIAKHPVGKSYEEKYNSLKAEYDRVNKEEIKKFLASKASIKFGIAGENATEANSFYGKLQGVGYEFDNSKVDGEIAGLYDVLSQIKDTQENYQNSSILADLAAKTGTYDILDVISSWNTQKKDSTNGDKRIIDLIKKGYDALPSGENGNSARNSVKTGVISPVVNGLINRARDLKDSLDSASQAKMTAAMSKLETAYNNTKDKVDSNLSTAFDELYVLTRKAAIAQLRAEIKESYGAIDPDLFNNQLFEAETLADLKAEGFTETAINAASVTVVEAADSGDFSVRVNPEASAREQLTSITGTDNLLSKATSVEGVAGVTEAWIDNNTGKVYVLKQNSDGEDEVRELTGAQVENGKVKGGTVSTSKVNVNDIATASATAKREAEELKTEQAAVTALIAKTDVIKEDRTVAEGKIYKEQKGEQREFVLVDGVLYEYKNGAKGDKVSAESIEAAYNSAVSTAAAALSDLASSGKNVAGLLTGWTDSDDDEEIGLELDKINKDNVVSFLKGYYDVAGKGGEGLIEKLDDDTWDENVPISLEKKIIKAALDKAKEMGLENEMSYKRLSKYYDLFDTGKYKDCTSFNKCKDFWSSTWLVGALWGGWTNYNEAIDDELEKLFDKMNA